MNGEALIVVGKDSDGNGVGGKRENYFEILKDVVEAGKHLPDPLARYYVGDGAGLDSAFLGGFKYPTSIPDVLKSGARWVVGVMAVYGVTSWHIEVALSELKWVGMVLGGDKKNNAYLLGVNTSMVSQGIIFPTGTDNLGRPLSNYLEIASLNRLQVFMLPRLEGWI